MSKKLKETEKLRVPYCEVNGKRVYSDPPDFCVGEKNCGDGDRAYPGWAKRLREAGITKTVIGQVKTHFVKQRESRYASLKEQLAEVESAEDKAELEAELESAGKEDGLL